MNRLLVCLVSGFLLAASGVAAESPRELSRKDLHALLASAASPQDHLRLAGHYEAEAKRFEADAAGHADSAKAYRARPTVSDIKRPMAPDTAGHCEYISESLGKAAKEARALSAAHAAMAKK